MKTVTDSEGRVRFTHAHVLVSEGTPEKFILDSKGRKWRTATNADAGKMAFFKPVILMH